VILWVFFSQTDLKFFKKNIKAISISEKQFLYLVTQDLYKIKFTDKLSEIASKYSLKKIINLDFQPKKIKKSPEIIYQIYDQATSCDYFLDIFHPEYFSLKKKIINSKLFKKHFFLNQIFLQGRSIVKNHGVHFFKIYFNSKKQLLAEQEFKNIINFSFLQNLETASVFTKAELQHIESFIEYYSPTYTQKKQLYNYLHIIKIQKNINIIFLLLKKKTNNKKKYVKHVLEILQEKHKKI